MRLARIGSLIINGEQVFYVRRLMPELGEAEGLLVKFGEQAGETEMTFRGEAARVLWNWFDNNADHLPFREEEPPAEEIPVQPEEESSPLEGQA